MNTFPRASGQIIRLTLYRFVRLFAGPVLAYRFAFAK